VRRYTGDTILTCGRGRPWSPYAPVCPKSESSTWCSTLFRTASSPAAGKPVHAVEVTYSLSKRVSREPTIRLQNSKTREFLERLPLVGGTDTIDDSARLDLPRLRTVNTRASAQAKTLVIQHHASTIMGYATSMKKGRAKSGLYPKRAGLSYFFLQPHAHDPARKGSSLSRDGTEPCETDMNQSATLAIYETAPPDRHGAFNQKLPTCRFYSTDQSRFPLSPTVPGFPQILSYHVNDRDNHYAGTGCRPVPRRRTQSGSRDGDAFGSPRATLPHIFAMMDLVRDIKE
jgi:hypothetical protein